VDQWGVNRVKAEAVVLQEGEREAPWELLYVSAHNAAGRCLTVAVCPVPNRSAGNVVLLWSGNHPHQDLPCDHLPPRHHSSPFSRESKPSFAIGIQASASPAGCFASKEISSFADAFLHGWCSAISTVPRGRESVPSDFWVKPCLKGGIFEESDRRWQCRVRSG
jgi:hypothetical protein